MNVRCPVCGSGVKLAVGDTQLACTACGLAAPLSRLGTADGAPPSAQLALETDLTGTMLAGKKLVERIGVGGMGTVYRARGGDTEKDVAIKVLRPGLGAERAAMLARFSREAEAMRRLEHVRIVRLLDHGEQGDLAYIVTELVEGRDLAARLTVGRMSLAEIVDVFGQVCDGVAGAHTAGIVHRDLKPANILVGKDGGVKVADFGLAQLGADISIPTLTRTNVAMGTFHYLAPEQRKDARAVDHRADIWALGVILYEMLTGELPLGSFVPPSTLGPAGCDRRVDAIVNRALAPDPTARYGTVAELARDVRALVAKRRVSRLALAAAAALVLAGGSTAAAFALSGDNAPRIAAEVDAAVPMASSIDATTAPVVTAPIDAPPVATAPIDAAVIASEPERAGSGDVGVGAGARPVPASDAGDSGAKPPRVTRPGGKIVKVSGGKVSMGTVPVGEVPVAKPGGKGKVPVGKPVTDTPGEDVDGP